MLLDVALWSVTELIVAAGLGIALSRSRAATAIIYAITLISSLTVLGVAFAQLVAGEGVPPITTLPLGLPWLGAHFRLDALAA